MRHIIPAEAEGRGRRLRGGRAYQEEGAPAGDVGQAHGDALVLAEAQPHVAALRRPRRHRCAQQRFGAPFAQIRVALVPCASQLTCHGGDAAPKDGELPNSSLLLEKLGHVRHVLGQVRVDCKFTFTIAVSHHPSLHDSFCHSGGITH